MSATRSFRGSWSEFISKQILADHDRWARSKGGRRLHLQGCCLDELPARGTTMIDARFEQCSFVRADLSASILDDVEMEGCVAHEAAFSRTSMDRAILYASEFVRADLRLARLRMADIVGSDFTEALLDRADFGDAILKECCFRKAYVYDATLDKAYVGYCDFRDADLSRQDEGLQLCSAVDTWFFRCDFRNANFDGRLLRNAKFTSCRFHGMRGKPVIEGSCVIERPNLDPESDHDDTSTAEDVLAIWEGRRTDGPAPASPAGPALDMASQMQRALDGDLEAARALHRNAVETGAGETAEALLSMLTKKAALSDDAARLLYELAMRSDPGRAPLAHEALAMLARSPRGPSRQRTTLPVNGLPINCLDWAPAVELLVAGIGGRVAGFALAGREPNPVLQTLAVHDGQIVHLSVSLDGRRLCRVHGSRGARAVLFDSLGDGPGRALPPELARRAYLVCLSPDGSYVAVAAGGAPGTVTILAWDTLDRAGGFDVPEPLCAMAFSPDAARLAAVGRTGRLEVWSLTQARLEREYPAAEARETVVGVRFAASGVVLMTVDGRVHRAGEQAGMERAWRVPLEAPGPDALVFPAAVSPSGRWLARSLGQDVIVVEDLVEMHRLGHCLRVSAPNLLCWTQTGHLLAVDSATGRVDRFELGDEESTGRAGGAKLRPLGAGETWRSLEPSSSVALEPPALAWLLEEFSYALPAVAERHGLSGDAALARCRSGQLPYLARAFSGMAWIVSANRLVEAHAAECETLLAPGPALGAWLAGLPTGVIELVGEDPLPELTPKDVALLADLTAPGTALWDWDEVSDELAAQRRFELELARLCARVKDGPLEALLRLVLVSDERNTLGAVAMIAASQVCDRASSPALLFELLTDALAPLRHRAVAFACGAATGIERARLLHAANLAKGDSGEVEAESRRIWREGWLFLSRLWLSTRNR